MTIDNFKKETASKIEAEIKAWKNGDKNWNVNNQFDETTLESALEALNDVSAARAFRIYGNGNYRIMDIAFFLSTFEAPELDAAWTR